MGWTYKKKIILISPHKDNFEEVIEEQLPFRIEESVILMAGGVILISFLFLWMLFWQVEEEPEYEDEEETEEEEEEEEEEGEISDEDFDDGEDDSVESEDVSTEEKKNHISFTFS